MSKQMKDCRCTGHIGIPIIFILLLWIVMPRTVEAVDVQNLEMNKTYEFNLDKKGKEEQISYSISKEGVLVITINKKTAKKMELGKSITNAKMQITDLDVQDGCLDIWVFGQNSANGIGYTGVFQYKDKKLNEIWNIGAEVKAGNMTLSRGFGRLETVKGDGTFTMLINNALNTCKLMPGHTDRVTFRLDKGKIRQVTKHFFNFYKVDEYFVTKRKVSFLNSYSKFSGYSFVLDEGMRVYPMQLYMNNDKQVFVLFKTDSGQSGWLCASDYKESSPLGKM